MPKATPAEARDGHDTRARIFDAAEALFLEHGFDGTTLRMVTTRAEVNLAAVNYHFGGKEGLFREMLARRLDALNQARRALLAKYRRAARGAALPCEQVLAAMFIPALALARDTARGGRDFLRLLGRAYVDPSPVLSEFLSERYAATIARFKDAFADALPEFPRRELAWRLHFMMGALAYTLAGADAWRLIAALNPAEPGDDERLLRRLAPFLIAGLTAPLPDLDAGEAPRRKRRNPGPAGLRTSLAGRLTRRIAPAERASARGARS